MKNDKKSKVITEEVIQQINELYQKNFSQTQTAKALGVSPTCVTSHLNEESLKLKKQMQEDKDTLYYYLIQLFGMYSEDVPVSNVNWVLISSMFDQGISYKEQYLALKYYYEICGHKVQDQKKTVGIIPYIIDEAREYYQKREAKKEKIGQEIIQQMSQEPIVVNCNPKRYNEFMEKQRIRRVLKGCGYDESAIAAALGD